MKFLIIGAGGQLGRTVYKRLTQQGYEVATAVRAQLDLENPFNEDALDGVKFDAVINCAAVHSVDAIESDLAMTSSAYKVNAVAVEQLVRMCDKRKAHFIHVSTDYVFGNILPRGFDGKPRLHTEDMPTSPLSVYGTSKAKGEQLALSVGTSPVTIARVAGLFSYFHSSSKGPNFVDTMLQKLRKGDTLKIVDDQLFSPTYAYDAACAIEHLARFRIPGIFHCSNSGYTSWFGLAAHAYHHSDIATGALEPCATLDRPRTAARRPEWSAMDVSKLERYGFFMPHWTSAVRRHVSNGMF